MHPALARKLGLAEGETVKVRQGEGEAVLEMACDERLPGDCVRVATAHQRTSALGPMFGTVTVERV